MFTSFQTSNTGNCSFDPTKYRFNTSLKHYFRSSYVQRLFYTYIKHLRTVQNYLNCTINLLKTTVKNVFLSLGDHTSKQINLISFELKFTQMYYGSSIRF